MTDTAQPRDASEAARGADKKEAFHQAAGSGVHCFSFDRPGIEFTTDKKKIHVLLAGTESCRAQVQVLAEGGENNLHYHPHVDLIYMVLKGKVRFYGLDDKLFGEYGPNEGISLPRNARYWFESASEEELHLLQIAGYPDGPSIRSRGLTSKRPNRPTEGAASGTTRAPAS